MWTHTHTHTNTPTHTHTHTHTHTLLTQGKNQTTWSNDLLDQDYDQKQKEKEAFATEEVEQMDENLVAVEMLDEIGKNVQKIYEKDRMGLQQTDLSACSLKKQVCLKPKVTSRLTNM